MKEISFLPNQLLQIENHFHWNIYTLFEHLKVDLCSVKIEDIEIASIDIDIYPYIFIKK